MNYLINNCTDLSSLLICLLYPIRLCGCVTLSMLLSNIDIILANNNNLPVRVQGLIQEGSIL